MQTWKAVDSLKNFDNSSNPPSGWVRRCNHSKRSFRLYKSFNQIYVLRSQHTYRPLRTCVVSGCFITCIYFRLQRVKQSNRKTSCRLELREFTLRREAVWEPNKLSFSCTNICYYDVLSQREKERIIPNASVFFASQDLGSTNNCCSGKERVAFPKTSIELARWSGGNGAEFKVLS